eukprot:CAMPEP_0175893440 /NCGR_PEP_ID=MMETSP0107_2-20121207/49465_1 /TAXON_ID=195067 ORGANISM="Goniomonas pacifica, Strain CCMP1869" /NCGR_SAMPLE_ID=MMETSP0107_2 /ASSEMBLY_ACC=CAM_ASM_000203 /LENGTH=74 /DNA_ID=CAMNT_0017214477 /DNA_START=49 /DNA_END=269 /DNA_ORIENTATION=+
MAVLAVDDEPKARKTSTRYGERLYATIVEDIIAAFFVMFGYTAIWKENEFEFGGFQVAAMCLTGRVAYEYVHFS